MSSFYVKCYVPDFGKVIRVYLDNSEYSCSFISANLISNLDPSAIKMDEDGEYACLDLIFRTRDGDECIKNVAFDVIDTDGNEFVLGNEFLQNYYYDSRGIIFREGEVKVYFRD